MSKKYLIAAVFISQLASAGMPEGSIAYQSGDYVTAYKEFSIASDAGNSEATDTLIKMFLAQKVSNSQYDSGLDVLSRAAQRGHIGAQKLLGRFMSVADKNLSLKYWRMAADLGDPEAQVGVGQILENGFSGLDKDVSAAFVWYTKAAEAGYALGHLNLGRCYSTGISVDINYQEAIKQYRLAVKGNEIEAYPVLAIMYERGHGVLKDPVESSKLLKIGANKGSAHSMVLLGLNYARGYGVKNDKVESYKWLLLASERTNPDGGSIRQMIDQIMTSLESELTSTQRANALNLAKKWKPNNEQFLISRGRT